MDDTNEAYSNHNVEGIGMADSPNWKPPWEKDDGTDSSPSMGRIFFNALIWGIIIKSGIIISYLNGNCNS